MPASLKPYSTGRRLLFDTHGEFTACADRLRREGVVQIFSGGLNRFDDQEEFPYYLYVTRNRAGQALQAGDCTYLEQVMASFQGDGGREGTGPAAETPRPPEPGAIFAGAAPSRPGDGAPATDLMKEFLLALERSAEQGEHALKNELGKQLAALQRTLDGRLDALETKLWARVRQLLVEVLRPHLERMSGNHEELQSLANALGKGTVTELLQQIDEKERDLAEMRELMEFSEQEHRAAEERAAELQKQRDRLAADLAAARQRAAQIDEERRAPNIPESLGDMLFLLKEYWPGRITILDNAAQSAESGEARRALQQSAQLAKAWQCLKSIPEVLHPLVFGESGNPATEYLNRTGFEFALTESEATKANGRLRSMRMVQQDGREWDCSAHVKARLGKYLLRVYLAFDQERKVIVIGHCGDHLPTAGTGRL